MNNGTDNEVTVASIQSELQLAHEDLRWSEYRYRNILEQSRDGIIVIDAQQHIILDLNHSMAEMCGYARDELLSESITEIWTNQLSRIMALERAVMERHAVATVNLDCTLKDGKRIGVEVSASLIDLGGSPSILCVVRDDTEHEQDQAALQESEQKFRAVTEAAHDAIIVADSKGTIISWNQGTCQMFGYTDTEMRERSLSVLIPDRYRDKHSKKHNEATSNSERRDIHRTIELEGLRSDSTEFPLELSISTWKTKKGTYTTGIIRDITKRKQAEEALLERENRFRSFFMHAPEYCYIVSPGGTIADVNKAALQAMGYERNELIGKPLASLIAPESQERVKRLFSEWMDRGDLPDEEIIIVTKAGEYRHILLSTGTVMNDRGELLYSISIQKDITELKQAQEHMARAAKLSALGQLAAGIAHEVNNPLNVILLATDTALYRGEDLNDDIRKALVTVKESAIWAGEIVANILEFARERPMHRQPCSINDLIDKVLNITAADIRNARVEVRRDLMTRAPKLQLDTIQIMQVFMNMILNAIQAMPEGGTLTIRTTSINAGRNIAVEFVDTGLGITKDRFDKIFDPFFTTKPEGVGTGLGLSISYGLVDAHGGDIKVRSKVGEGTTFTILFPTGLPED